MTLMCVTMIICDIMYSYRIFATARPHRTAAHARDACPRALFCAAHAETYFAPTYTTFAAAIGTARCNDAILRLRTRYALRDAYCRLDCRTHSRTSARVRTSRARTACACPYTTSQPLRISLAHPPQNTALRLTRGGALMVGDNISTSGRQRRHDGGIGIGEQQGESGMWQIKSRA